MNRCTSDDRPLTHKERLGLGGTLAILALIILACGCDHQPPTARWQTMHTTPVSQADTARSVFKVEATQLNPDGTEGGGWTGTAWIAAKAGTPTAPITILMTAGHICEPRTTFLLVDRDSHVYHGAHVLVDDDTHDLCALVIPQALEGPVLPIAVRDPNYGDRGWYVGAPHGLWGGGIAGIYETEFSGRGRPFDGGPTPGVDSLAFSTLSAPGASGSPVLSDGHVVGVLNAVAVSFNSFMIAVPWQHIQTVLDQALAAR